MNRNIQSPTKLSSWTSFVTSNNSGFNVIPTPSNNGNAVTTSIINMSGAQQQQQHQQQSFTATIQNNIQSNQIQVNFFYTFYFCVSYIKICIEKDFKS